MNFNNKYYINKFKIRNLWRDFVVLTKMIPKKETQKYRIGSISVKQLHNHPRPQPIFWTRLVTRLIPNG